MKVAHSTSLVRIDPRTLLEQTVTFPPVGSSCDGGTPPVFDAGTPFDAGSLELDAGIIEPAIDAGASTPGRAVVTATLEGCGCASSAGATWLSLVALSSLHTLVLALRKRRRSAANER